MNIQSMLTLYDYSYWATRRILAASARLSPAEFAEPAAPGLASLRDTLVHALDGECAWRTLYQQQTLAAFGALTAAAFPSVASLTERWQAEEQTMRAYLAQLSDADLTAAIRYTTAEGDRRERLLWHCLIHVVNHGTQHRSEAAVMLTALGASPGALDFTAFLNEQP